MKKRMTIMISALIIVFGGIIAYNLYKHFLMNRMLANITPLAVAVSSVTAKQQDWTPHINAVGNFVAINGVEVTSQASGNVVAIHFDSGQYVEANELLIDVYDSVDQATLKSNQAEVTLQTINYKRYTALFKKGDTPAEDVNEALAKKLQALAAVLKTQETIGQKHIRAPFSGQLGIRQVNLGQYITPGKTVIAPLQSMDPLYLQFYVPEQLLNQLHVNQPLTFSVEQNPNVLFEGKITAINSRIDINTHNIEVQATINNCPALDVNSFSNSPLVTVKKGAHDKKTILSCNSLLNKKQGISHFNFIPGMFASIEIALPILPNIVVLPTTAISYSLYGNSVYIIEKSNDKKDKKEHLVVKRVFVTTGDQHGNYTVIKKGVKAFQQVVGSGELKLHDGTPVIINNEVLLKDTENPDKLGE